MAAHLRRMQDKGNTNSTRGADMNAVNEEYFLYGIGSTLIAFAFIEFYLYTIKLGVAWIFIGSLFLILGILNKKKKAKTWASLN